ncbi:MAG: hypothetical protein R2873_28265 [Caldilineaceae bacterium]
MKSILLPFRDLLKYPSAAWAAPDTEPVQDGSLFIIAVPYDEAISLWRGGCAWIDERATPNQAG